MATEAFLKLMLPWLRYRDITSTPPFAIFHQLTIRGKICLSRGSALLFDMARQFNAFHMAKVILT
ncbi:MAG: hypothetical protein ACRDL7_04985, partial [Gaiellaceae bacterium]